MPYGTYYKPGDWNVIDDLSGFRLKHSQAKRIPGGQTGGLLVARERWEPQQPQDFVRGVVDDQSIPGGEARPRQPDQFIVVATFVIAFAERRTSWITVSDAREFYPMDRVSIMLNNGEPFYAVIGRIIRNQLLIVPSLPGSVGSSINNPIENTVLRLGPSNLPLFLTDEFGIPITDEGGDLFSTSQ